MTPAQTAQVTALAIQGGTIRDIEAQTGISRSSVHRGLAKPEIKALIEREATEIINRGLKPARRTLTRLAAIGNTKGADKDMLKLSLDASKHITSMAGLSGNAPGTIINALIQVNQAPEQSSQLNDIQAFLQAQWQTKQPTEQMSIQEKKTGIEASHTPQGSPDVIDVEPLPGGSCQGIGNVVDNSQLST